MLSAVLRLLRFCVQEEERHSLFPPQCVVCACEVSVSSVLFFSLFVLLVCIFAGCVVAAFLFLKKLCMYCCELSMKRSEEGSKRKRAPIVPRCSSPHRCIGQKKKKLLLFSVCLSVRLICLVDCARRISFSSTAAFYKATDSDLYDLTLDDAGDDLALLYEAVQGSTSGERQREGGRSFSFLLCSSLSHFSYLLYTIILDSYIFVVDQTRTPFFLFLLFLLVLFLLYCYDYFL
jgi:hypothetical protein